MKPTQKMAVRTRLLSGLVLLGLSAGQQANALPEDANAIINKMYTAYAGLTSYEQQVGSTILESVRGGNMQVQGSTSQTRFAKPNKMYVNISSPIGSIVNSSNGQELLIYRSQYNNFEKKPAPATPLEFVKEINRGGTLTLLDPLYFLSGQKLPPDVSGLSAQGTGSINGTSCYKVVGNIKTKDPATTSTVTFWIETKTYLLRKVTLNVKGLKMPQNVPVVKNGKQTVEQRILLVDRTISEVVQDMKINPSLDEARFTYDVPKNATEINLKKYLGGN
jgi:outer membrane lipoprotein-sorting protein